MQTKPSVSLIGSPRMNASILGVILVVAAITASLVIWQRSATPLPVQLSATTSALDRHERHPGSVSTDLATRLDQHERHFLAGLATCRSVGPDELQYVDALLNGAQLQRYLDGRRCPPAG